MKKKPKSNDVVLRANDMKFSNGASYSGAIKDVFDSRPHGFGIYFYPDHLDEGIGDHLYRGNFKDAKFHGHGEYVSKDYNYKGEFKNQKFHGRGEYSREGYNYKGEFKNDKPDGKGIEILYNEDSIYTGSFKNGLRHGYGISKSYKNKKDKNQYKGQWVKGSMTIGIFEFTDGGIYDGQLKNNNFHGKGTLTETKGKNAGEVYKGTWKDGKKNGTFVFKDKKGKKTKELWKDDNFIKFIK